eukprot:TRINITY_DN3681_c0_g1_i1.p1 TRINITY_DN3681_c0_g1~~TRINITY_DN3681_c0_g1_i1.p1  ORF type:complete len:321 (+),score=-15.01 TRINITY_DN3681_c0_g1_i1:25-987(+)
MNRVRLRLPLSFLKQKNFGLPNLRLNSISPLASRMCVIQLRNNSSVPDKPKIEGTFDELHTMQQLESIYPADDVSLVTHSISHLWPVLQVERVLMDIHSSIDLPWWSTIVLFTLGLRFIMFPVNLALLRNSLRLKTILPEVKMLDQEMINAQTSEASTDAANRLLQLYKEKKCHPLNNFSLPTLFPPLVLSVFGAVHNLSIAEPGMTTGGTLWFIDLVEADPTWMLPTISALTWLWAVECAAGAHYFGWPAVRTVARSIAIAFIPVTSTLPSGVFIFWITSNLFAIGRTYFLRLDSVRRYFGMPLVSEINSLPYLPERKL